MFFRVSKNDLKVIFNYIGQLLIWSSYAFLIPLILVFIYNEPKQHVLVYLFCFLVTIIIGYLIKSKINPENKDISFSITHATIVTVVFWILFNLLAAIPFVFIENMGGLDSVFESVSATTTTGLTTITNLSGISYSILFWRSLLSWFGGLGVVLLALLGVLTTIREFSLLAKAEGHTEQSIPNIKKTVFSFWYIYIGATAIGIVGLTLSGMGIFYSFNYAMSAISTTGIESINNGVINFGLVTHSILAILMIIGATSFITHYLAIKNKSLKEYFRDYEFIFLISFIFLGSLLLALKMNLFSLSGIIGSLVNSTAAQTGGGFITTTVSNFASWDEFVLIFLIVLMFIGGSTASTSGGIKIHRFIMFLKTVGWKIKEIYLPKKAYFVKKFHSRIVSEDEIRDNLFFIGAYFFFAAITAIILTLYGFGYIHSLFETLSAQSNVGISVGITSATLPIFPKILLICNMIIGRLEIIPLFALIGLFLKMR